MLSLVIRRTTALQVHTHKGNSVPALGEQRTVRGSFCTGGFLSNFNSKQSICQNGIFWGGLPWTPSVGFPWTPDSVNMKVKCVCARRRTLRKAECTMQPTATTCKLAGLQTQHAFPGLYGLTMCSYGRDVPHHLPAMLHSAKAHENVLWSLKSPRALYAQLVVASSVIETFCPVLLGTPPHAWWVPESNRTQCKTVSLVNSFTFRIF